MAQRNLAGIGIGVPGFIQFKEGIVRKCQQPAVPRKLRHARCAGKQLGAVVILENDANAAALGEK